MPRKLLLGAFGDPGHAFPMIALGSGLAARGHDVTLQTWTQWREHVEAGGMTFAAAPEYHVFPTRSQPLGPYEAAVVAALETQPLVASLKPDVVVSDILTLAPALAGELEGVPVATLIPHVFPPGEPGFPPYSLGARLPRTAMGRGVWRRLAVPIEGGVRRGRDELNLTRSKVGLPPTEELHGGISRRLTLVGTFPQLEYPRRWPDWAHVVGPMMWEPPSEEVELPPGDEPLVLVAPSTSQDPNHRLLESAVRGLSRVPVRVLATWNRRPLERDLPCADNVRLVEWVSYARTMPRCDVVVCHAGHGTVARALASGCTVVCVPAGGDMNENSARVDWAGVGVRVPPRFCSPTAIRLAVERAVADARMRARAREVAAWMEAHDPAERAAELVEVMAGGG